MIDNLDNMVIEEAPPVVLVAEEPEVVVDYEPVVEDAAPDHSDDAEWPEDHTYYTIEDWKGFPNYSCRYCDYKSVSVTHEDMVKHFIERHTSAGVENRVSGLVGPDGRLL